jgi:asparagine N-glycosylation enzyme membrane subunit Stt3
MKKLFRYSALVLGLVLSAFFLLMSLDSFPGSLERREVAGFIRHLIPGLILVASTLIAFKKPWAGVIIFTILSVLVTFFYSTYSNIQLFIIITLPMIIITFLLYYSTQKKIRK